MRHLIAASVALLLLAAAARLGAQAQSGPSVSADLSPGNFVPMDAAITGTITIRNLDPTAYSQVIFRADVTPYNNGERGCNGDDTGTDIEVPVDSATETFAVRIYDACPSEYHSYGTYALDLTVSRLDDTASGGRVELAAAQTQFSMSRYLTAGEAVPAPPEPGAAAWVSPDSTTLGMRALGEWQYFRVLPNCRHRGRWRDARLCVCGSASLLRSCPVICGCAASPCRGPASTAVDAAATLPVRRDVGE